MLYTGDTMSLFNIAWAGGLTLSKFMINLNVYIFNPLITAVFLCSLAYFMWGVVVFIYERQNGKPGDDGKRHLLWGIIGMFIMSSVYGILQVLANTVSSTGQLFK